MQTTRRVLPVVWEEEEEEEDDTTQPHTSATESV